MSDFPIPVLARAVEDCVGSVRAVVELPTRAATAGHGPRVWRIDGERGRVFAKQHPSGRGYAQERAALEAWALALAPASPRLLAFDDEARALLLSEVQGRRASTLTDADDAAIHRAAGEWLAQLHALDPRSAGASDPMGLDEAIERRLEAALAQAPRDASVDLSSVHEARARAGAFAEQPRVACHRDFTSDNWLWDGVRLGVVDFEHARADCWLVDLAKLAGGAWADAPALEHAFFDGYGRRLEDADRERLDLLVRLHGLRTWTWGLRHGDAALAEHGRRILGRRA